uniref:Uncharacterized protein n=1 Tax=Haptolina brevifila TaxID=156173 RepID=A0A7S2J097_9EUKA
MAARKSDAEAQLQAQLIAKTQLLESTTAELSALKGIKADLPRLKKEVATAKEEVRQGKMAELEHKTQITDLQQALRLSKQDLEEVFGKLKFAEQESASLGRLRSETSEDKRQLHAQQQAAAEASVRLVTEASEALGSDAGDHPIFGELLADLGYKRLYRGAPSTLWAGTLMWERQRAFRQSRASLIAASKARSPVQGWPGSITIVEQGPRADAGAGGAESSESGVESTSIGVLIDGQHRLGAAHLLAQRGKLEEALGTILVEVYPPMNEQGKKDLFTEINRAEPVLLVDLPDGGASADDNVILTEAAEALSERYPTMFKPSHSCRSPHVNVDVLRAELHRVGILSRHQLTTSEQLVQWLETTNAELGAQPDAAWARTGGRSKSDAAQTKALGKARDHNFFLGLSWEWLDR